MSLRNHYLILFLLTVAMMATALYFQYIVELEPCPLCISQRIAVIAIGIVALVALLHNPGKIGQMIYNSLLLISAISGVAIAGRHVWLQHLPPEQAPACGPGLEFWLETLPLTTVIEKIFKGTGECAKVDWTFLGFSIPELTLPTFTLISLYVIWLIFKSNAAKSNNI